MLFLGHWDWDGVWWGLVPVAVAQQMTVRVRSVAPWDRDVELGIAPHAVLGDVQARRLDVLLDADAPHLVHRPEAAERRGEREAADGDQAEGLHAELVETARVDEPARAGREVRGQR